jgi:phage tail-like protein
MAKADDSAYPFVAFRFDVRFERESFGGFTECTGLNRETQTQDYLEGGVNDHVHKFPGRTVQSNVVLKRGVIDRKIWDWHDKQAAGQFDPRDVTLLVFDANSGKVDMEFRLKKAFPCKLSGPELNATQNNVAVETLELCHQGIERKN